MLHACMRLEIKDDPPVIVTLIAEPELRQIVHRQVRLWLLLYIVQRGTVDTGYRYSG